jgi:hypothetical protein
MTSGEWLSTAAAAELLEVQEALVIVALGTEVGTADPAYMSMMSVPKSDEWNSGLFLFQGQSELS